MTPPEAGWSKSLIDCNEKIVLAYPLVRGLFREVHPNCDLKVDYTYRSQALQFELFKKGRTFNGEEWIINDPKSVVTKLDGRNKLSKHNAYPSDAADIYIVQNGKILWCDGQHCEDEIALYTELGHLWEQQGLVSGIAWKFPDRDHVQVGS